MSRLGARRAAGGVVGALALAAGGCGGGGGGLAGSTRGSVDAGVTRTATTRVEVVARQGKGGFDASALYAQDAPGVVTVVSVFGTPSGAPKDHPETEGLGSGFVVSNDGEIATNAHVVSSGAGSSAVRAKQVYVQFGDGNQVPARILGTDLNADIALVKVDPAGLTLRPLQIGTSHSLVVGTPVAAIGSPFGEPQSLSVGVISATNRSIDSLNSGGAASGGTFAIQGAIQTDAAINHGNSGGPLVDAAGRVIGVNAQIQSTGGGGEGVGFAIPADTVKRSVAQLREKGSVDYAYVGVTTVPVYPQLAEAFKLPVKQGALVQTVAADSPASKAGLHGPTRRNVTFEASELDLGGDVIAKVDGRELTRDYDLATAIQDRAPGDTVTLLVYREGAPRTMSLRLGSRPG